PYVAANLGYTHQSSQVEPSPGSASEVSINNDKSDQQLYLTPPPPTSERSITPSHNHNRG
ncbi:hypothetical protein BDV12DRAFT_160913, partial [Aspergillus spectabilis]